MFFEREDSDKDKNAHKNARKARGTISKNLKKQFPPPFRVSPHTKLRLVAYTVCSHCGRIISRG